MKFTKSPVLFLIFLFLTSSALLAEQAPKKAKYVFFFIGDGMGNVQIHAAEAYLAALKSDDTVAGGVKAGSLTMSSFPVQGLSSTFAHNRFITDSAAAGTALATGHKTEVNRIATKPGGKAPLATVAESAKKAGLAVGIMTSVSIDHATPACFYAHVSTRYQYHEIAMQLADTGFDFFGGGMRGRTSKEEDALKKALEKGFLFADTLPELQRCTGDKPVICWNRALAGSGAMFYDLDRAWLAEHGESESEQLQMSLADITREGIRILEKKDRGFFMMIEGGKIDWACHANDPAAIVHDVLAMDRAVAEAVAFYEKHPDETLIVITADHECGGMTLGFAATKYSSALELLARQKVSGEFFEGRPLARYIEAFEKNNPGLRKAWKDDENDLDDPAKKLILDYFGLDFSEEDAKQPGYLSPLQKRQIETAYDRTMNTSDKVTGAQAEAEFLEYGGYDPLSTTLVHIVGRKAGIGFASFTHTAAPVRVLAKGAGAEAFLGYYDNTDIPKKIAAAMGIKHE